MKYFIKVVWGSFSILVILNYIILIVALALYVGVKYNFIKDYPVVVAGLGAALLAFLGVVVSQAWQSSNTNKNIKSAQKNLQDQLTYQRNIFDEQILAQKEQSDLQHKNSLEIKRIELDEQRYQKRYEEFGQDRRDLWLKLLKLQKLLEKNADLAKSLAENFVKASCNQLLLGSTTTQKSKALFEDISKNVDLYHSQQEELDLIEHNIGYLHNVKKVGDEKMFSNFMNIHRVLVGYPKKIISCVPRLEDSDFSSDENKVLSEQELFEKYSRRYKDTYKEFRELFRSDKSNENNMGYKYAYNALLDSVKNQEIN